MEREPHYHSNSVVGKIYDCMCIKAEDMEWHPAHDKPFDARILSRYQLDDEIMTKAGEIKVNYDTAMRRLMGQHEAPVTEFEIWSTFILSKPRVGNDYKLQENVGREVSALKERFRTSCVEAVTGVVQKQSYASACTIIDRERLDRFVAAMYTVTFDQVQAALRERALPQVDDEGEVVDIQMPLISFPWLFHRELARVALGREGDVRPLRRPAWDKDRQRKGQNLQHSVAATDTSEAVGGVSNPEETMPEEAMNNDEKEPQMVHEVRSKKEGGRDDRDKDIGEDYVRTSSGKIIHRGQVLELFTEDNEGVGGPQPTAGSAAGTSVVKDPQPRIDTAKDSPVEHTPESSLPVSRASAHEHDDDEEEFEEFEFEEVGHDLVQEEEDALEVLAKKIGM